MTIAAHGDAGGGGRVSEEEPEEDGQEDRHDDREGDGDDADTSYQAIDHDVLTMKLIGALQEAFVEIDDLKARLDAAGV